MAGNKTMILPDLPEDPARLLVNRIDAIAVAQPFRVFASVLNSDNLEDGFRDITFAELARAIDKASRWLDDQLGNLDNGSTTFAYIGPRDLRYIAVIVAAIKTSRTVFLPSPFLSIEACSSMLDKQACRFMLFATPVPLNPWFDRLSESQPPIQTFEIPSFDDWFNDVLGDYQPYKYEQTWQEAIDHPAITIHSSGTTGLPKLITYRNSTLVYFDSKNRLAQICPSLAVTQMRGRRLWSPFPMFHLGGIYTVLLQAVYGDTQAVLGPPSVPPSATLADQMIRYGNISVACFVPALLEDIVTKPRILENVLQNLEAIQVAGAPLAKTTGDIFRKKLHIQPEYASTEHPVPSYFRQDDVDWQYFHFHPCAGLEFCYRDTDLFELVVIRKEECKGFQPTFTIMPEATHFNSGDLWSPHSSRSGLWKYSGRVDDIIMLSTGAALHTMTIEAAIQEDLRIRAAILDGAGRPQPYLILELEPEQEETETATNGDTSRPPRQSTLDHLWPIVRAVNDRLIAAEQNKIPKRNVIVATIEKPFKRLAKLSVDRKGTIAAYENEIENLYSGSSQNGAS